MEELFRVLLRAPLRNPRWSWGAVRDPDQAVFLRVWEDEKVRHGDNWYMRLTAHAHFAADPNNNGWQERLQHLALVQNGAVAYMVMCEAVDPKDMPRKIKGFNNREVYEGGALLQLNGDWWLELVARRPIHSIMS
jgi:hypothetical protein